MHGSRNEIPVALEAGKAYCRDVIWGKMNLGFEGFPAGMDTTPLFNGLPDGKCQCPHWGYVIKGKIRVKYSGREEEISAGEAYYMEPGHNVNIEEDCELVEFSPPEEIKKTMDVVRRNLALGKPEKEAAAG